MSTSIYRSFDDGTWQGVTERISRGDYVLVLGNEGILNPESEAGTGDIRQRLNSLLRKRQAELWESGDSSIAFNQKNLILDVLGENVCKPEHVSPDLISLLKTQCFRVVLTTGYDSYVEEIMRGIWGDNLRVLDIYGDKSSNFDFSNELVSNEFYDIQPTLYYIFGKADPGFPQKDFVADDNDSIVAISKWMNANECPRKFINYLKNKSLLAIGCKFEDWFFRFFWYVLRRDIKNLKNGQVAITLSENDSSDVSLGKYLKSQLVHTYPDASKFMQELSSRMYGLGESFNTNRSTNDVFISYAGEDSAMATILYRKLEDSGIDVWMDSGRLFCGDTYESRIQEAINSCKVFLTLLSPQVIADLSSGKQRYYMKEWDMAKLRIPDDMRFFPVTIDGYDVRGAYHQEVESRLMPVTAFDMRTQPIGNLVERIKMILGK